MSTARSNAATSQTPRALELPSIEVTHDEESSFDNRSTQSHTPARQERRRGIRSFSALISGRGALSAIPHFIFGITLIATGSIMKKYLNSIATIIYPPPILQLRMKTPNISIHTFTGTAESKVKELQPPSRLPYEDRCQALTCNPNLSLACIAVGCMVIFCGFSGGMMIFRKAKEYVFCHLLWLSVSALCSVILAAACVMGVESAYANSKGLAECICIVIAATVLEVLFCAVDLCFVNYHFSTVGGRPGLVRDRSGHSNSVSTESHSSARRRADQRNAASRGGRGTNSDRVDVGGGTRRERQLPSSRNNASQPNSSRSRRAVRDGNSLHPGYQPSRNRTRRRPVLRAQNHYVLVPAAYGRSRVSSRVSRTHTVERRNRVNMPMFVIANHDRYVQALNRSMETLETEPNRGSVPGDVLPSYIAQHENYPSSTDAKGKTLLEKADSLETTLSTSSMESSKVNQNSSLNGPPPNTPIDIGETFRRSVTDNNAGASSEEVRRRLRGGSGYSVVRRSKDGMKITPENPNEPSQFFNSVTSASTSWTSHQKALAQKLGRAASVVEDSVFEQIGSDNSRSSQYITDTEYSSPSKTPVIPVRANVASRARLYNTSSEGDFSAISATNTTMPLQERKSHASVSSDSGIAEASNIGAVKMLAGPMRRHYYNVPMKASPRVSLEMRDLTASNPQFSLSPVSPNTPSYENVNSQAREENFVSGTKLGRSVSAEAGNSRIKSDGNVQSNV